MNYVEDMEEWAGDYLLIFVHNCGYTNIWNRKNTALVFNDLYGGTSCEDMFFVEQLSPANIVAGRYCFYSCFLCPQGHFPAIGGTIGGRAFTPSLGYSQLECWNTYLLNTKNTTHSVSNATSIYLLWVAIRNFST